MPLPDPTPSSPQPPVPSAAERRGRWVAIVTGALSVLVGVLYLLMIVLLDSRGPLQPPPPEALGVVSVSGAGAGAVEGAATGAAAVAVDSPVGVAVPVPSAAAAPQPG